MPLISSITTSAPWGEKRLSLRKKTVDCDQQGLEIARGSDCDQRGLKGTRKRGSSCLKIRWRWGIRVPEEKVEVGIQLPEE
ncbi:hypothetical protein TNCV_2975901 [Trichonephila clavipes]|nr:hypothetical protein TNCV_2975901 [Trichonephila clavipes]